MSKINTTGDVRTFVANMMIGVRDGIIEVPAATQIINGAKAINDSLYSEVRVGVIRAKLTGEPLAPHGALKLGETA